MRKPAFLFVLLAFGVATGSYAQSDKHGTGYIPTASWGVGTAYADAIALDSPLRKARNAVYDDKSAEGKLSEERVARLLDYPPSHDTTQILPLTSASVVAIGTVIGGRTYISNNQTAIYSEMHVRLDQILSNRSVRSLAAGTTIDTTRAGGVVLMPSGRVLIRGAKQESIPRIGRQYLLLLNYARDIDEFPLISGFELSGEHVYMLDGMRGVAGKFMLQEHGVSADKFLHGVREAVSAQSAQVR